jgi:hypothetical protein
LIEFKYKASSTYDTILTYCDGTSSTIILNKYCSIPMSIFLTAPYSYSQGDLIIVAVSAINIKGPSTPSIANTAGALASIVPLQMNAPTIVSKTDDSVEISWSSLTGTNTGGMAILSYNLFMDTGGPSPNLSLID